MPWGLKRFHDTDESHFVTFSCYHHRPFLATTASRRTFELALERVRHAFRLRVYGYVVMPDHVHLLLSEPERQNLADALKSLKQGVSRRLLTMGGPLKPAFGLSGKRMGGPFKPAFDLSGKDKHFWQKRYYDFNVRNQCQFIEKLRYIHRNPVRAGLCERPEDGRGAAFVIMQLATKELWRSSRSGRHASANEQKGGSVQLLNFPTQWVPHSSPGLA